MPDYLTKFKNAESLIADTLQNNPDTRSSDIDLIMKVWERQGLILNDYQKKLLHKVHSPESIRRTRQKLQERGLYRPSKEVQEKRKQLSLEYRNELRKPKLEFDEERQVYILHI